MTRTALDKVFSYMGNTATPQDYFDAARELLDMRRKHVKTQAEKMRARRQHCLIMMKEDSENIFNVSDPFIKAIWMHTRHEFARMIPRATIPAMRRELESLTWADAARHSPEYQARMNSLPCGMQDAADERRHEDATLARLLPLMIWLAEWDES